MTTTNISVPGTILRALTKRQLRPHARKCLASIFYNFFFCQYRSALLKKLPISRVDHELDARIPFTPAWDKIYMDFTPFWIRLVGFLLGEFGKKAWPAVIHIFDSVAVLYDFAGEIYGKNLSTTTRPFHIKGFRFFLMHACDPHLMCIPSLHVMVMIRAYTQFAKIMKSLVDDGSYESLVAEIRRGARDITEAILYVKQHSVNCVAASMYAMTRFDPELFPPEEAEDFAARLFTTGGAEPASPADSLPRMNSETADLAREYILGLYRIFLSQGAAVPEREQWAKPLLDFLASCPRH
ncbi:MAG: hypothetical protein LBT39_11160 [Treponema sp.]|jgi:hypothetical protein|nr:hypothetical protein [Treponema sp.]